MKPHGKNYNTDRSKNGRGNNKKIKENGIGEICKTAERLVETLKEGSVEILTAVIEAVDEAIVEAKKERRKDGITVKERKVERRVMTSIGELKIKRTYFKLKYGRMSYLTDQVIGIEPFERVTKELCAKLVQNAATMSMEKSEKVLGECVSRQTVNNKVLAIKDVVTEIKRRDKTPTELHILADEDHVHLRPKRNAIVPLVTVTEGIDTTNKKRHKTIAQIHFQGYGTTIENFVENVVASIYEKGMIWTR